METIDERVETLEMTVARFITNTNAIIQRLDRTCEWLDRSYEQVRQEMEKRDKQIEQRDKQIEQRDKQIDHSLEQLKRDAREHALEMAHIADRIGRFAEDIVGPNIPPLGTGGLWHH